MFYQSRHLPHWHPEVAAIFPTWRLYGSYPAAPREWKALPGSKQFVLEEQLVNDLPTGPHHLKDGRVARVADPLRFGAEVLTFYDLQVWVVMSNYVHWLTDPKAPISRTTQSVKNHSAQEANRILNRSGHRFWQKESYDRWVRSQKEFDNIARYIKLNPVKAGLVSNPEDWIYSSAWGGQEFAPTEVTHAQ